MCRHSRRGFGLVTSGPRIDRWRFRCEGCQLSASGATAEDAHRAWKNARVRHDAIEAWKRGEEPKNDVERRVLAYEVTAPTCHHP